MSKDLFSSRADVYARYRPVYPSALFDHILQFVHQKEIAWDCATGNGQAAVALAKYFKKVYATDISEKQLALAVLHENIEYKMVRAEETDFPDQTFDLVTVAQAYHWFNFNAFENEVRRVAKKDAVIAVWGYSLFSTGDKKIDLVIKEFYTNVVGSYWDDERKYVDGHYNNIPFNFKPLPVKEFLITTHWGIDDLAGYINSWSSVQHFIEANQFNPVNNLIRGLGDHWDDVKQVSFPLFLRIGRV